MICTMYMYTLYEGTAFLDPSVLFTEATLHPSQTQGLAMYPILKLMAYMEI